jgi:hypothetical protein
MAAERNFFYRWRSSLTIGSELKVIWEKSDNFDHTGDCRQFEGEIHMSVQRIVAFIARLSFAAVLASPALAAGFVDSVVKAPIAPDGDVAGAPTDIVIYFTDDLDPAHPGLQMRKGEKLVITLPKEVRLIDAENFPVRDLLSAKDCVPGIIKCSTGVLLHGWPQNPILPSFPPGKEVQYTFTHDPAANTITYEVAKDLDGLKFEGPGVKQAHLLLLGFHNPDKPGTYPIQVAYLDANGQEIDSGAGDFLVRPDPAPSINVTSVFVPNDKNGGKPPNPSTIYQQTTVGQAAPMPWDFLVWDTDGKPFVGLELAQKDDKGGAILQGGNKVGSFTIKAPTKASGQKVTGGPSVALPATPVIGKTFGAPIPVGRLTAQFTAGNQPGRYTTALELDGGTRVVMVVDVASE